jgi:hypothetical protein
MSRVQAGTVNASSGVTTQTTTLTGCTLHNLLELSVHWDMNAASGKPTLDSTAVTAGWLEAGTAGPQVAQANAGWITGVTKFYLQNCPAGSNACKINFASSARTNSQMCEYSGYAQVGPLDKVATQITGSATTITATTATTSQATELVTASIAARFVASNSNIGLTNPPTGFTSNGVLQDTNTYAGFESAYKEVVATGAQTATWSWTGAGEAAALVVTYGSSSAVAATLSSPTPSGTLATATTATPGATTDTGSGTGYTVVTTTSLSGVTAAQVKAGQNAAGSTTNVFNSNGAISATGAFTLSVTGLTAGTLYNYAVAQNSAGGDSNVVTGTFTTHAPLPNITSASSMTPANGSTLTLTGTTFGSSQGAGDTTLGGASQVETSWNNTTIALTVDRTTNKSGVAVNVTVTNNAGDTSTAFALTSLQPAAGWSFVDIGTPDTTAADRLTTTGGGDLASGDQVEWGNVVGTGTVTVSSDGTFAADPGVTSFDYRAWSVSGGGWGTAQTEDLTAPAGGTASTAVVWF